jgi:hypothetical protein
MKRSKNPYSDFDESKVRDWAKSVGKDYNQKLKSWYEKWNLREKQIMLEENIEIIEREKLLQTIA